MASVTDYADDLVLDDLLFAGPWYLALYTTILDSTGVGTECADANYARQALAFAASSGGSSLSSGDIYFPAMAADQTILSIAIFDAVTAGNMWYFFNLATGVAVLTGQQARALDSTIVATVV